MYIYIDMYVYMYIQYVYTHTQLTQKNNNLLQVQLFVCNQEEDIRYALEVGATGVMTDYPSLLTSYFSRNPIQD